MLVVDFLIIVDSFKSDSGLINLTHSIGTKP
jgi:hypothetical protein